MIWAVRNRKNNYQWPAPISDGEKNHWESSPQGKNLEFTQIKPIQKATTPVGVKTVEEKEVKPKKRKRTKKASGTKPDGNGSGIN